jgi:hypothetical protein
MGPMGTVMGPRTQNTAATRPQTVRKRIFDFIVDTLLKDSGAIIHLEKRFVNC